MTIEKIAKLANTSKATVSLALNNRPGVNPETRKKILDIASEEGYVPKKKVTENYSDRSKTIKLIAVLKPETSGIHNFGTSFFAELINSIQNHCSSLGYDLIYSAVPYNDLIPAISEQEPDRQTSGILLIGTYLEDEEIRTIKNIKTNLVVVDRSCSHEMVDSVVMNNYMGGYEAASHLLDLGHQNIGYICSSTRVSNLLVRSRGFRDALADRDKIFDEANLFYINSYHQDSVRILEEMLSKRSILPSAFFCENDYNAICLVSTLTRLGIQVPWDISVIGFDDVPEISMINPRITTVHVDKKSLGITAVNRLHELITGKNNKTSLSIMVNVRLEIRDTAVHFQSICSEGQPR